MSESSSHSESLSATKTSRTRGASSSTRVPDVELRFRKVSLDALGKELRIRDEDVAERIKELLYEVVQRVLTVTAYSGHRVVSKAMVDCVRDIFRVKKTEKAQPVSYASAMDLARALRRGPTKDLKFSEDVEKEMVQLAVDILRDGTHVERARGSSDKGPASLETYLRKVLKSSGDVRITGDGIEHLEKKIKKYGNAIAHSSVKLLSVSRKKMLSEDEIDTACRVLFLDETGSKLTRAGQRAITKVSARSEASSSSSASRRVSIGERADLSLSVARVRRILDKFWDDRITSTASVYLAAVLERLAQEIIKLSHDMASAKHKVRVTEEFINASIISDSSARKVDRLLCGQ